MSTAIRRSQPPAPKLDGRVGRSVGDYLIVAELARGGMGRVYLARRTAQAGFERQFAIKVMSHELADDQDALLMLLDEAHIASRLHHPNVVSVLDIGVHDEGYYLVMDYVEGLSLQQLMKCSPDDRPVALLIPILLGALEGLHAVHTLKNSEGEPYGVVHRDVSPHNLLVGLDGACRVTDFGIAKARERLTDTRAGIWKGKLSYMSPEQLRGKVAVDCRADIWAAGVTLYAAITGVHPFAGENHGETLNKILHSDIAPPSEVGLKPPACFDALILRALDGDPERRFATAQDFSNELRNVAMREHMLGAPGDVASWIEEMHGYKLAKRRKMVAGLARSDSNKTSTGSTRSLPKLWSADNSNDSISGNGSWSHVSWSPVQGSFPADASSRQKTIRGFILFAAVGAAAGLALWGDEDRWLAGQGAPHGQPTSGAMAPAAKVTPAPQESAVFSELPKESSVDGRSDEPQGWPTEDGSESSDAQSLDDSVTPEKRPKLRAKVSPPRRPLRPQRRSRRQHLAGPASPPRPRQTAARPARDSAADVKSEPAPAASVVKSPELQKPAVPERDTQKPKLDRNPYLSGE